MNEENIDNNEGVVKDANIFHQQCSKKNVHTCNNNIVGKNNYCLNPGMDNNISMVVEDDNIKNEVTSNYMKCYYYNRVNDDNIILCPPVAFFDDKNLIF